MEQVMVNEVPIGSDVSRAVGFFDSRHIEHTGIVQLDDESRTRPDTLFSNPKLDPQPGRRRVLLGRGGSRRPVIIAITSKIRLQSN